MLLSLFPHLCFKVAPCSSCSESHILCFKVAPCFHVVSLISCLFREFFIIELGLYIPPMGFLKMPQVFMSKQVGCTPTSFILLSIYSSSASVAWQSLLLMLTSIDGHLHSSLIILINVRLSLFRLLHTIPIIIFYSTHSVISMAHAHVLCEG